MLVHGTKRWLLFPPNRATYSTVPIFDYLRDNYTVDIAARKPIEFLQHAGEIVILPAWYAHATVCVGDCMALSRVLENSLFDSVSSLNA